MANRVRPDDAAAPPQAPAHAEHLRRTWHDFNRALRSPEPFHQWHWLYQLSAALLHYLYCASRLDFIVRKCRLAQIWRPLVPALAFFFIIFCAWSYFTSFRHMLRTKWCESSDASCATETYHSMFVFYVVTLILWNFFVTTFRSPGIALPPQQVNEVDVSPTRQNKETQGGCCGVFPRLDPSAEQTRVQYYGNLSSELVDEKMTPEGDPWYYPSTDPTYCNKCQMKRPPRCHHCKTCDRCILQMDHCCPWVNNCIGYNNYRTFFLFIFWLAIGCWYGVAILSKPFYELFRDQVKEYGFRLFYANKTGILDIPLPLTLLRQAFTSGIETTVLLRMVFPLLLGIALVMTGFAGFHIMYIVTARTTLEHKVMLSLLQNKLTARGMTSQKSGRVERAKNPFDEGSWQANARRILGPNPVYIFLPIPVTPPPPFVPSDKMKSN